MDYSSELREIKTSKQTKAGCRLADTQDGWGVATPA